ncbi:MAG: invasion associated locus B family protein [Lactobacillaceae bacterium]|jgi:invasion protein IalB|nr:invasion associated locus B family protein [Lactobacillaceae bacterium]
MKKILSVLSLSLVVSVSAANASSTPATLGEYDDWIAYSYKDAGGMVCYMASTPKKDEGKYTKRGDIYVVVTHRPKEKSFGVVNFVAGYDYKPGAAVTVKIGKKTIDKIFTDGDKAWAINDQIDKDLVDTMRKGDRMIVSGTSSRGTTTKDTYSLRGFTSAYKAITAKCK